MEKEGNMTFKGGLQERGETRGNQLKMYTGMRNTEKRKEKMTISETGEMRGKGNKK